jgi:hypothetical protein
MYVVCQVALAQVITADVEGAVVHAPVKGRCVFVELFYFPVRKVECYYLMSVNSA